MKSFKVVVRHISGKTAPSIFVDAANDKEARNEAKAASGLGKFDSWEFTPIELKRR